MLASCSSGSGRRAVSISGPTSSAGPSSAPPASSSSPPATPIPATAAAPKPGTAAPAPASSRSTTTARAAAGATWPTYHLTPDRAGDAPGITRPGALATAWKAPTDQRIYGQPLVVGGTVIAATENNTVYAFDLGRGSIRWHTHLADPVPGSALPCGNIDPLGITGTPAYDAGSNAVFVVTETTGGVHTLVALDATSGVVRFSRNVDVGGHDRIAQQQRGALAIANGRVYVPFGGLYGDCGDYVGYIAAVPVNNSGPVGVYKVPTSREGGIWAPSGAAVAGDGTVFASVGNGAATGGAYDGSDSVVHLTADLSRRIDFFAPDAWAAENANDTDLGSTGPLLTGAWVVVSGKDGNVYLLDAAHLGGIGGQVAVGSGCTGFGGLAADRSAVFVPCAEGLQRFDVSGRTLSSAWRVAATGSPVVGGGAVWVLDTDNGVLHTFDESSGAPMAAVTVGPVTRFASPVLVPGFALVAGVHGVVAVTT